ncbi:hypothetical protein SAMN04487983_1018117 [Streptomyces sp. yr375]|uniref:hypothetical protein n=1 Tax=Streptomyces sp. yr375 TaxID=1761906 RepID=UPI0008BE39E6|nr:hypothetical protein [Streptomyces sp. yr375]SER57685.1 hypothetical protein SAMN04487983_1018117 [Streptomyces sp. yr375]
MQGWKRSAVITGCLVLVVATVASWVLADLDTAGQVASVIGCVTGIAGLLVALLGSPATNATGAARRAVRTGRAVTTDGGRANTGVASRTGGEAEDTGDASSHGGKANTGVSDDF